MKKLLLYCSLLMLIATRGYGQSKIFSGRVTDKNTNPLQGVTVVVVETQKSAITDYNGNFKIEAEKGQTLNFSYVGLNTQKIKLTSSADLQVTMLETDANLNEVVVTGYKTERKKDLSGAVSIVNMTQTLQESNANILTDLQSRVPGVEVESDGTPGGDGTSIRIRGFSTLQSNGPLFVIDGVATTYSGALNPDDIESIQVL